MPAFSAAKRISNFLHRGYTPSLVLSCEEELRHGLRGFSRIDSESVLIREIRVTSFPAKHDAQTVQRQLGPLGLAGFFCNGEIGPIGTSNFLHGFTASIGIFQEKE